MNHNHMDHMNSFELIYALPFVIGLVLYIWAAIVSNRRYPTRKWPSYRYAYWFFGVVCAAITVVGPLAKHVHGDFIAHMVSHLLLGMLSPILIVLSAPLTLLLRTLRVPAARCLSRIMHSWPIRFIIHPIIASTINIGGLWLLYMSDLYLIMQHNFLLHLVIHLHVFIAGYIFTASMIYIDPIAHRFNFAYRAVILGIALTGHTILSKYIYIAPPVGVSRTEGEVGAMLMYYGGDVVDIIIIFMLYLQWYKATRPQLNWSLG